jgi:UDP-N-acetylglucosamine 2-epimerase
MTDSKPLLALCYGTRPQIIKASVLRRALATNFDVVAVDTGQHYDFVLNELLYRQLDVAPPDHYLEVGSGSHAAQTGAILGRVELLLARLRPAVAAVIGDTNSTLGCALAASKLRIPVAHIEAGLRACDRLMAEELNRRATGALARILCAPSAAAARRLEQEHPDGFVRETGDIARDVLLSQLPCLPSPESVVPAAAAPYLFATVHRAELTDRPSVLRAVLEALGSLPLPTVLAMHPRTRAALERNDIPVTSSAQLTIIPAAGYREALALLRGAAAVLTDSGGIQREAYWLGVPCVTLRGETEWAETLALGANRLVKPEDAASQLAAVVERLINLPDCAWDRDAYGDGHAAQRVAAAIRDGMA